MVEVGASVPPPSFTHSTIFVSAPPPQTPDVVVQHQEFLEHHHPLALATEFAEQLPQPATPGHVEPERLGEILLWMRAGVTADVIDQRRRDAAALEIDPVLVGHAVRPPHLAERAPGAARPGPRPAGARRGRRSKPPRCSPATRYARRTSPNARRKRPVRVHDQL